MPARSFYLLLGLLLVFGSRAADPAVADPATRAGRLAQARAAVATADAALAELEEALREAADAGRRGSALTVAGDTPPGAALLSAADQLEQIAGPAGAMTGALDRAREAAGTLAAVLPEGVVLPLLDATPVELYGMAVQLRAAAAPADAFAARRHQAEDSMQALAAAVAALDADAPAAALPYLDALDLLLAGLRSWSDAPATFSAWLAVIGEFGAASRALADASLAGDADALATAARRYATASEAARGADQALGLAMAEGGAAIAATPLRRLADLLEQLFQLRGALAVAHLAGSGRIERTLYSLAG